MPLMFVDEGTWGNGIPAGDAALRTGRLHDVIGRPAMRGLFDIGNAF
jgi:hypothetical protein